MKGVQYVEISVDGTAAAHIGPLPLDEMQLLVGGNIDVVAARGDGAPDGLYLVVNDEGVLAALPENQVASRLYYSPGYPVAHRYGIRGDVLVIRVDDEGETADLTDDDVETLLTLSGVAHR